MVFGCGWLVTLDFRQASGYGWLDNEANQRHTRLRLQDDAQDSFV